jgi:hypothetical protein
MRAPRGRPVPYLTQLRCADRNGNITANTDTYFGCFARIVPGEQVVEVVQFETGDAACRAR